MTMLLVGRSLSGAPATVTIGPNTEGQETPRVRHDADPAWEMEFLRLWNWVENQGRHECNEEQSKKHHKNGAQDQDLAPRSKEGAQCLTRDASREPDQQYNSPSRMRLVLCVGRNLSLLSQGTSETISVILAALVPVLPLILTSWVTLRQPWKTDLLGSLVSLHII